MTIHKNARLTPVQRREIADKYNNQGIRICDLCRQDSAKAFLEQVMERLIDYFYLNTNVYNA